MQLEGVVYKSREHRQERDRKQLDNESLSYQNKMKEQTIS